MAGRSPFGLTALFLMTIAACGGSGSGGDAALPATTNYFSCDETYTMGAGPLHTCLEYSNETPFAPPSPAQCTPTANGYMGTPGNGLSTTAHCPRTEPGCVCVHDDEHGGHYEEFRYQTAADDGYHSAARLCGGSPGGMLSCFGGLMPPTDAGAL